MYKYSWNTNWYEEKNKWFVFHFNTQENTGCAMQGTVRIMLYSFLH